MSGENDSRGNEPLSLEDVLVKYALPKLSDIKLGTPDYVSRLENACFAADCRIGLIQSGIDSTEARLLLYIGSLKGRISEEKRKLVYEDEEVDGESALAVRLDELRGTSKEALAEIFGFIPQLYEEFSQLNLCYQEIDILRGAHADYRNALLELTKIEKPFEQPDTYPSASLYVEYVGSITRFIFYLADSKIFEELSKDEEQWLNAMEFRGVDSIKKLKQEYLHYHRNVYCISNPSMTVDVQSMLMYATAKLQEQHDHVNTCSHPTLGFPLVPFNLN